MSAWEQDLLPPGTPDLYYLFLLGFAPRFLPPVQCWLCKARSCCAMEQGKPGRQRCQGTESKNSRSQRAIAI